MTQVHILAAIWFVLLPLCFAAQFREEKILLPKELSEISGITNYADSIFIVHNDGGNAPYIYFISDKGLILHKCYLKGHANVDWEDITSDGKGTFYLADIGNNLNDRRSASILSFSGREAFLRDTVSVTYFNFSYAQQKAFPPAESELEFDAEALTYFKDSLTLVSKSRAKPWIGNAYVYRIPLATKQVAIAPVDTLFIGSGGWMTDCITGASSFDSRYYLLTYSKILSLQNQSVKTIYRFRGYSQVEGICAVKPNRIFVVAERHKLLGGPYLFILSENDQ